jgi:recombination protein RecT
MHALKTHFQAAYKMTAGTHLQQDVQAVYAQRKVKLEEVTQ